MKIYVKDTYLDENKDKHEQLIPIEDYCIIGAKKANGSLYELELKLSEFLGRDINLKRDFPEVRKDILNMSGQLQRLPNNIVIIEED